MERSDPLWLRRQVKTLYLYSTNPNTDPKHRSRQSALLEKTKIAPPMLLPLLLLPFYLRPQIPSSFRYPIYRLNQVTAPLKNSDFVSLIKEKRRQTRVTGTMETEMNEMGTGRPRASRALQVFEVPLSVRRTMHV